MKMGTLCVYKEGRKEGRIGHMMNKGFFLILVVATLIYLVTEDLFIEKMYTVNHKNLGTE